MRTQASRPDGDLPTSEGEISHIHHEFYKVKMRKYGKIYARFSSETKFKAMHGPHVPGQR